MVPRAVSTRTRFEVFKRDGFKCLYCGATPVASRLHVDHVVALANGGTNAPSNLVTACKDCNLGKSAVPLERKALGIKPTAKDDADHAQQILKYLEAQRDIEATQEEVVEIFAKRWEEVIGPLNQEMYDRMAGLMDKWPFDKLDEAMRITAKKLGTVGDEFNSYTAVQQAKYFYGVLRTWREAQ